MALQANDLGIYEIYAGRWWDGSVRWLRTLHNLVPARLAYFDRFVTDWSGKTVLDVGCGGGFMAEALAKRSADVVGVDPSEGAVHAARVHAMASDLFIDYRTGTAENLAFDDQSFDVVVCVDVLEHVADIELAIKEMARVLKPGGLVLFDTINRNWLAKFVVVTAAERIVRLLPRGAHDPDMFIRPQELRALCASAGLSTTDLQVSALSALTASWTSASAKCRSIGCSTWALPRSLLQNNKVGLDRTMLRTFECPQCGMPFVFRLAGEGQSFTAVDHQLWLETCLDDFDEHAGSEDETQPDPRCPSQHCTYARETASIVANVCNGTTD